MVPPSSAHHYAVGVKELIGLPPAVIADRFNLSGNEGAARLFAGSPSDGLMGGGFCIPTGLHLSGAGVWSGDIAHATKSIPQMLEDFKQHPTIRPLIAGGELLEYSAHMVPEGGLAMVPKLVDDGVMIVGDAAGFCLNWVSRCEVWIWPSLPQKPLPKQPLQQKNDRISLPAA